MKTETFLSFCSLQQYLKQVIIEHAVARSPAGWDFSSRWLRDNRTLASCCTTDIVPVDLNAFLYQMESNMADFAARLGHEEAAATFRTAAEARRTGIDELMHNRSAGTRCCLLWSSYMSTRHADSLTLLLKCVTGGVVGDSTMSQVLSRNLAMAPHKACCIGITQGVLQRLPFGGDTFVCRAVVRPAHHIHVR